MTIDKVRGVLLGTAVGDALGMPVEGMSHQNVRMYYKGIKGYRADEKRGGLEAGQWTDDTQLTFALVQALAEAPVPVEAAARLEEIYVALLPEARRWGPTTRAAVERLADGKEAPARGEAARPTNGAAMRAAPLGVWWASKQVSQEEAFAAIRRLLAVTHRHPTALAAGFGQAFAVRWALEHSPATFERAAFWPALIDAVAWAEAQLDDRSRACSRKLRALTDHLDDFPLDLHDACGGAGIEADASWPFAAAMFARRPDLLEATLLSAVNVGGDADTVGAMAGALLGALHGWAAFPADWRGRLEAVDRLKAEADAFYQALAPNDV